MYNRKNSGFWVTFTFLQKLKTIWADTRRAVASACKVGVGITSLIPRSRRNRASFGYFDPRINDNLKGLEDLEIKKKKNKPDKENKVKTEESKSEPGEQLIRKVVLWEQRSSKRYRCNNSIAGIKTEDQQWITNTDV